MSCRGIGTLEFILSSFPSALRGVDFIGDIIQVLKVLAETICGAIDQTKCHRPPQCDITFMGNGELPSPKSKPQEVLFERAHVWQWRFDLEMQFKFPENFMETILRRLDNILASDTSKQGVLVELTAPQEEWKEEASQRKRGTYAESSGGMPLKGVAGRVFAHWSGARGFAEDSFGKLIVPWASLVHEKKERHQPSFGGSRESFKMTVDHEEQPGLMLLDHSHFSLLGWADDPEDPKHLMIPGIIIMVMCSRASSEVIFNQTTIWLSK